MPRHQREKSNSGYYHIMLRGNERKNLFRDDEDKLRFIETVGSKKQENRFSLHAFCLMDNHVHLMLSEGVDDVANAVKRISVSYVNYFNKKYKRVGHLFQDRFKSEVVEDDSYILTLARYIHRNPVKAGMVESAEKYKWSSYQCYVDENNQFAEIVDTDLVLGIFSKDRIVGRRRFRAYTQEENPDVFIDLAEDNEVMEVSEAKKVFENLQSIEISKGNTESQPMDALIREFRKKTNLSIRQIAEISGFRKGKVHNILSREQ